MARGEVTIAGPAPFFYVEEKDGVWQARFLGDVLRGTTCGACGTHVTRATPAGVGPTAEEAAQNAAPGERAWIMQRDEAAAVAAALQYVPHVEGKLSVVGAMLAVIERLEGEKAQLAELLDAALADRVLSAEVAAVRARSDRTGPPAFGKPTR